LTRVRVALMLDHFRLILAWFVQALVAQDRGMARNAPSNRHASPTIPIRFLTID